MKYSSHWKLSILFSLFFITLNSQCEKILVSIDLKFYYEAFRIFVNLPNLLTLYKF